MDLILFLVFFPALTALVQLVAPQRWRGGVVVAGCVVTIAASVLLLGLGFQNKSAIFTANWPYFDAVILGLEVLMALFIVWMGVKYKRYFAPLLAVIQSALLIGFEITVGEIHSTRNIMVDSLTVVMALVIGIIGCLIIIYGVGYMRSMHADSPEISDRRPLFFAVNLIFISAMFGIVFSNNLLWLYFFWEVTTLCSFLLIGYKRNAESINNAFLALAYNLIGGLGFAIGIVVLYSRCHSIELQQLLVAGDPRILLPVALLSFAGISKSAQLPFSRWLLGAMVAPAPVSALLHSSTMVKAGVYLIVRFGAVLQDTWVGYLIALVGALTFVVASLIAVAQHDAKRVLALSTIANLGLVVLCAGVGTYEAIWAAVMLIVFHAVSKALLFLCVGIAEHNLHSRDIEDMSGMIVLQPKVAVMMLIGMAGMFLAPFGMLVAKWAVLRALVDYSPLLTVFVVFGSSATLFFWVKWMGKIITVADSREAAGEHFSSTQWWPMAALAFGIVGLCGLFPVLSSALVEPYVVQVFGQTFVIGAGNVTIMLIMLAMVLIFELSFLNYGKLNYKVVDAYLGGANTGRATEFIDSLGAVRNMEMQNYYLDKYFGEERLLPLGVRGGLILLVVLAIGVCL